MSSPARYSRPVAAEHNTLTEFQVGQVATILHEHFLVTPYQNRFIAEAARGFDSRRFLSNHPIPLGLILSWLIAKRLTQPIEHLAAVAQAVTAGDYSVSPNVDRRDEVGILGRSFAQMITALRDKAELWIREQGIVSPARWAGMYAPGFLKISTESIETSY